MKGLVLVLGIALLGSAYLNWQLYGTLKSERSNLNQVQKDVANTDDSDTTSKTKASIEEKVPFATDDFISQDLQNVTPQMREKAQAIYQIRQQLAAGEIDEARDKILAFLREHPRDIDYLLLEADLVRLTSQTSDILQHFYALLDLPLNTEQRGNVLNTIAKLTIDNIEKLKSIRSWDVLATFLEPLWQFDPNRKSIILGLAEAYARQGQEFLMENVLASLPQDDLDVTKIRSMLANLSDESQVTNVEEIHRQEYDRALDLKTYGDHYIAQAYVGRTSVNLMIDTGASTTVLTERTFQQLRRRQSMFDYVGTYKINTAGGQVYAPIYQLKQLFIGGFRLDDLAVVVLPMQDFNQANGLLGMNLLRQFDFKIDQQNNQLLLNRFSR